MFKYSKLKNLHLEITNRCQAACPMCSRNYRGEIDNPYLKISDWTLNEFNQIVNDDLKAQLSKIMFCGNYGDPLLNQDFHLMVESLNHFDIFVDVHTNGSLRSVEYWANLAKIMPPQHRVVFAIDGLADTHAIYRRGTDYQKILDNAKAFIDAGGNADWSFIRFKHNAHQVYAAKQTAQNLGFKNFSVKDSSRFVFEPVFPVLDKNENVLYNLEKAPAASIEFFDATDLTKIEEVVNSSNISCQAQHANEIYIDAHKTILPCCFLAVIPYEYYRKEDNLSQANRVIKKQYAELVEKLGDTNALQGIETVLEKDSFQSVWEYYWNTKKLWTCSRTCGKILASPTDNFTDYQSLTST
jgi:MoaA/NifB/PqqE/SkfB family radical SAM enzyme